MKNIDFEKLLCDLIKHECLFSSDRDVIYDSLKKQGFRLYRDEENNVHLVEVKKPKKSGLVATDFKIEPRKSYMCIKDYISSDGVTFKKGKVYNAVEWYRLVGEDNNNVYFTANIPYEEYFRPATEEEVFLSKRKIEVDDMNDFKQCLIEFYNAARDLVRDKDGVYKRSDANQLVNFFENKLLDIARLRIIKEMDDFTKRGIMAINQTSYNLGFEQGKLEECEKAYRTADEMQYKNGYRDASEKAIGWIMNNIKDYVDDDGYFNEDITDDLRCVLETSYEEKKPKGGI